MNVNAMITDMWKQICCLQNKLLQIQGDSPAWFTGGNLGITEDSFLGSINEENLVFKTFNTERLRVTKAGLVGIGTTTPTTSLDIDGQIRIRGGSPGVGKILQSDADGIGSWVNPVSVTITADNGVTIDLSNNIQLGSVNTVGSPLLHDTYINLTDQYALIFNSTDGVNRTRFDQNLSNISLNADKEDFSIRNNVILSINNIQLYQQDNVGGTAGRRLILDRNVGTIIGEYDSGIYKGLIVKIGEAGKVQLNAYGLGNFTGTSAYTLQVDSSGNIIEGALVPSVGSSIIPFISSDFDIDGFTVTDTSLNGRTYELFFNDLNRFLYNEIGNQEWDYVIGGGFKILIPGFDSNVNSYHLYLMFK